MLNENGKTVEIFLRDYLAPNGCFKYETLPTVLEEWRRLGFVTRLISVPGFIMLSGYPDEDFSPNAFPWLDNRYFYRSINDALKNRNGEGIYDDADS